MQDDASGVTEQGCAGLGECSLCVREVASYRNAAILRTTVWMNTAYRDATEPEVGINKKEFKKERHAFDQE